MRLSFMSGQLLWKVSVPSELMVIEYLCAYMCADVASTCASTYASTCVWTGISNCVYTRVCALARILLLASDCVTQTVAGLATVWERDGRGRSRDGLAFAADILMSNLDVHVHVNGRSAVKGDLEPPAHQ